MHPKKVTFDERARLRRLQVRLDAAPRLASQLVKQGIGLDISRLMNPSANALSRNRATGFQRVANGPIECIHRFVSLPNVQASAAAANKGRPLGSSLGSVDTEF